MQVESPATRIRRLAERPDLDASVRAELLALADDVAGVAGGARTFVARGGMGEVYRVTDPHLGRSVILKTLRPGPTAADPTVRARFVTEARVTALLDHPGVVPVYDLGVDGEGVPYFTMREIQGVTLSQIVSEIQAAIRDGAWQPTASGWTFARLMTTFERVCETVAYAHSRGVVHRDLKPDNVMVGAFGEVLVLDWGVAAPFGGADASAWSIEPARIAGTPVYMAPEQAWGRVEALDPRADVYSLGAVLYEILSGRRPYEGSAREVLDAVRRGPPPPPHRSETADEAGATLTFSAETLSLTSAASQLVPEALRGICERAMSREPADRHADARALAAEIREWLDGSERRELARAMTTRARGLAEEAARAASEAARTRDAARRTLLALPPWAPAEERAAGWTAEERAAELGARVDALELEATELLHAALVQSPGFDDAQDLLADMVRRAHADAEARRDHAEARRLELRLRAHDTGRHSRYLDGGGAVTLVTDPPGATVTALRYRLEGRRLVTEPTGELGVTPLRARPLAMGSYLFELRAPGRAVVRYPVHIAREQHWTGAPPGASTPTPVHLPRDWELGPDDVYVPAGWFRAGDGPDSPGARDPQRVWLDAFVVRRYPVTNAEYLDFLNDLVGHGRVDEALRHAPRERGSGDVSGALVYGRDAEGRFVLQADADGDRWDPRWPVVMVDWEGARAYAAWLAGRTGQGWRLLGEHEWEKAARGVDGRVFPWGDHFEATWARTKESGPGRAVPAPVEAYPTDESPYGVRGMAGGARTWCLDPWNPAAGHEQDAGVARVIRGGSWASGPRVSRAASRDGDAPTSRKAYVGVRVGRGLF